MDVITENSPSPLLTFSPSNVCAEATSATTVREETPVAALGVTPVSGQSKNRRLAPPFDPDIF